MENMTKRETIMVAERGCFMVEYKVWKRLYILF